jgi:isoleucyl-tRNA synthetase
MTTPPQTATPKPAESEKSPYRGTLNLPKTSFPMKANLVQNEPASLKRWTGLYDRLRQARAGAPRFNFHDGPPYANGSIHLGHLLNKCLKDFVVRTRGMLGGEKGTDCPYIPGWDCHGLPIEHKVMTELQAAGKLDKLKGLPVEQRQMAVRRECRKYAEKYQKQQAGEMQRLLTLADYEHPYMTMAPEFEGATLEVLASLLEQGLVFRALKPVHWSVANETALAEAELEYYDREDPSVYVDFEAADAEAVYDAFGLPHDRYELEEVNLADSDVTGVDETSGVEPIGDSDSGRPEIRPSFMIWTTTPWTLPANFAIAVNPKFNYALVRVDGNVSVIAADAVERVTRAAKSEDVKVLATTTGDRLVGLRYRHPFVAQPPRPLNEPNADTSRVWTLLPADYVTLEDGTGLVHTAPGHGAEDFMTGKKEGLPIYCPVLGDGTYDKTTPGFLQGMLIWKANDLIVQTLRDSGHMFFDHRFTHSYPHDWRGKTPVIFRCTEQWFVSVDLATKRDGKSIRQLGLDSVEASDPDSVRFVPEWGRNRMRGMLESRPDWCISRQRAWGLPIPAFFTPEGKVFMTPASVRAVAKLVREKGSDIWFTAQPAELLANYTPLSDPDFPSSLSAQPSTLSTLRKGPDILDVWFESGSTWNAVMRERSGGKDFPCDLYLEGSDQHRGWFQTSLLTSLGAMGRPPYKTLLTHGFIVDKDGHKMSKSLGNTLEVEELLKNYGADVCRWWVASLSYENDIKADKSYFDVAGESYRKVRNTLRFLLSNLDDFTAGTKTDTPPASLDAWILSEFNTLCSAVAAAYERYEFQSAHKLLYDFCNDTLSSTYLAAVKDRLYCDKADSPRRRRTQAALWTITDGLCRLLAPVLCHTADEAYRALWKSDDRCIHTAVFPSPIVIHPDAAWGSFFKTRDAALAAIERSKAAPAEGGIGLDNPLDSGVVLPDPQRDLARLDSADLADLLGASRVCLDPAATAPRVLDLRAEPRCDRSWKRDGTVKKRTDGGMLSDRDAAAVGVS